MSTTGDVPRIARISRNACNSEARLVDMGIFESVPALPFLTAVVVAELHAVLPHPLDRVLCRGVQRVLPADYGYALTATLQRLQVSEQCRIQ